MNVVILGPLKTELYLDFFPKCDAALSRQSDVTILYVEGAIHSRLAVEYASARGLKTKAFHCDYQGKGFSAELIAHLAMVENAEAAIAFWDKAQWQISQTLGFAMIKGLKIKQFFI